MIDYVCKCGARWCKLWRQYNTFLNHIELMCVDCAGKDRNVDVSSVNAEGYIDSRYGKTDQIDGLVPAVPTIEKDTFWGYTSVPPDRVKWWRELPTRPVVDVPIVVET